MFLILTKIQICNSDTNCYLCAIMKNMFLKYAAALLTVWYCMSIIGFDVHSCAKTGNTFVNSVLSGLSCEDVHPEHDCTCHGSCCHSHKEQAPENVDNDSRCCTNNIEVLESEGVTSSQDDVLDLLCDSFPAQFIVNDYESLLLLGAEYIFSDTGSWCVRKSDVQSVLNIWRI